MAGNFQIFFAYFRSALETGLPTLTCSLSKATPAVCQNFSRSLETLRTPGRLVAGSSTEARKNSDTDQGTAMHQPLVDESSKKDLASKKYEIEGRIRTMSNPPPHFAGPDGSGIAL